MKHKRSFVITLEVEYDSPDSTDDQAGNLAMLVIGAFEDTENRLIECSVWENRLVYTKIGNVEVGGLRS